MNIHTLARNRSVRIAVAAAGALLIFSAGAYALASTRTTASQPPHSLAWRTNHRRIPIMCPMIVASRAPEVRCAHIGGPIRACAPNAMCLRPCVMPVVVMTPAHPGNPVPPKMAMHGRCVILRGVNPGGPMIPAGSAGASGSAAGSPPAFNP